MKIRDSNKPLVSLSFTIVYQSEQGQMKTRFCPGGLPTSGSYFSFYICFLWLDGVQALYLRLTSYCFVRLSLHTTSMCSLTVAGLLLIFVVHRASIRRAIYLAVPRLYKQCEQYECLIVLTMPQRNTIYPVTLSTLISYNKNNYYSIFIVLFLYICVFFFVNNLNDY